MKNGMECINQSPTHSPMYNLVYAFLCMLVQVNTQIVHATMQRPKNKSHDALAPAGRNHLVPAKPPPLD